MVEPIRESQVLKSSSDNTVKTGSQVDHVDQSVDNTKYIRSSVNSTIDQHVNAGKRLKHVLNKKHVRFAPGSG